MIYKACSAKKKRERVLTTLLHPAMHQIVSVLVVLLCAGKDNSFQINKVCSSQFLFHQFPLCETTKLLVYVYISKKIFFSRYAQKHQYQQCLLMQQEKNTTSQQKYTCCVCHSEEQVAQALKFHWFSPSIICCAVTFILPLLHPLIHEQSERSNIDSE